MKRNIAWYPAVCILAAAVCFFAACSGTPFATKSPLSFKTYTPQATPTDYQAFSSSLSDWVDGTDYNITAYTFNSDPLKVELQVAVESFTKLTDQDKADIRSAIEDLAAATICTPEESKKIIIDITDQQVVMTTDVPPDSIAPSGTPGQNSPSPSPLTDTSTVNLVFIHHSCGENWLNDGLTKALNDANFHVADIYYGWREYGDRTDTVDWPMWFTDGVMPLVYNELNTMTASNGIEPAPGENSVIMFKSCYPNSDVGDSIDDEKAIYMGLIPYFEKHPDKMFVLVTPPPMVQISNPEKTRELCNWLIDRKAGWLKELKSGNVFVFDFYNVLTHPDAHHMLKDGKEVHEVVKGSNTLYYPTGDDHPSTEGNRKAAEEFMGLLKGWYAAFTQ